MYVYFPSCNFTRMRPELSNELSEFMRAHGCEVAGCCRKSCTSLPNDAIPVTICQTCNIILSENHPSHSAISIFEFIDARDDIELPDYHGEEITIQDCYRAKGHDSEKAAIRSLMRKMNISIVELPSRDAQADFDGEFMFRPVMPGNRALAPKRFNEIERDLTPMPADEAAACLRRYCTRFTTKRVACYCNSCLSGLATGLDDAARAVHIAELVFARA